MSSYIYKIIIPTALYLLISSQITINECRIISEKGLSHAASQNPYPESRLVSQLLQEDYEIQEEKDEISAGDIDHEMSNKSDAVKVELLLPSYLQEQFGGVGVVDKSRDQDTEDKPLARVWLPVEIKEDMLQISGPSISVIFQQTHDLGDFMTAEIVLTTLKNGNTLSRGPEYDPLLAFPTMRLEAVVNTLQKNYTFENFTENPEPLLIGAPTQIFYAINITQPLKNALMTTSEGQLVLETPHKLSVQLHLLQAGNEEGVGDIFPQLFDLQLERPFIIFYYRDPPHLKAQVLHNIPVTNTRKKRSTSKTNPNSGTPVNSSTTTATSQVPSHLCHRERWEVNTHEDIEWYDMLEPRTLELGFCTGSCPFPLLNDHYNYTLHAFFKDRHRLVKIFDIPKDFPKSCCVPISYKPIWAWIVEEDTNTYVMKSFHDVVVDQCGCR